MAQEPKVCVAVVAQTGKPCTRKAMDNALVCGLHIGMSKERKEAAKKVLKEGREKRNEALKKGGPSSTERWALLLSGQLTMKDLDDEEINRMQPRGKGGEFSGRHRAIPSHLIKAFEAEQHARWKRDLTDLVPDALVALAEILTDPKDPQRANMLKWTLERTMGKTPDIVRLEAGNEFERVGEAVVIDRGVADGASAILADAAATQNDEE